MAHIELKTEISSMLRFIEKKKIIYTQHLNFGNQNEIEILCVRRIQKNLFFVSYLRSQ